ncbi:hypothetical protein ACJD0Z_13090 [Flavobacteriaceae bacterium M23B6Z8]
MNEKDRHKDQQLKELIKEVGLQSPSEDFENRFMVLLENERVHAPVSKPLISKSLWFIIFFISSLLISAGYFMGEEGSFTTRIFKKLTIQKYKVDIPLPTLEISEVAFYSILLFVVMLFVQILLIKNRYSKTFSG